MVKPQQLDHGLGQDAERDRARRKAAEPLRPSVPQKPLDVGLFDGGKVGQIDIEDLLK